jgi:hypothetical protein
MGASPDGIIEKNNVIKNEKLIEIKCPTVIRDFTK